MDEQVDTVIVLMFLGAFLLGGVVVAVVEQVQAICDGRVLEFLPYDVFALIVAREIWSWRRPRRRS